MTANTVTSEIRRTPILKVLTTSMENILVKSILNKYIIHFSIKQSVSRSLSRNVRRSDYRGLSDIEQKTIAKNRFYYRTI